jgi:hypothetical protein
MKCHLANLPVYYFTVTFYPESYYVQTDKKA